MMRMQIAVLNWLMVVAPCFVLAGNAADGTVPVTSAAASPALGATDEATTYRAMLTQYCNGCHMGRSPAAGLALNTLDLTKVDENAATLEKVVRKLRGRMMPPPGSKRPDDATTGAFVEWMEQHLDAANARHPDSGEVALHRLNRKEYANAIRDLLALDVDPAALLPQDDTSDGFDNVAEVLQVSPVFLDQYISAARTVAIQAVGNLKLKSVQVELKPPAGLNQAAHVAGMPLGTRGGFQTDYVFPGDGNYDLTFTEAWTTTYDYRMRPDRFVAIVDGKIVFDTAKAPPEEKKGPPRAPVVPGRIFKISLPMTGGLHTVGGAYAASTYLEDVAELSALQPVVGVYGPKLAEIRIAGPANPAGIGHSPSRDAIFICRPARASDEQACARKILANIAHRAYRRPLTDADLAAPLRFYADGYANGGFDAGIQQGLMAIMASPKFLYRTTTPPKGLTAGSTFEVNDIDLASRLSFFLWSSIPDAELLRLAEQKKLSQPKVLDAQVRRMLADPKAESLVTNFGFQWLRLGALATQSPDLAIFPEFDEPLLLAVTEEMRLFMDSVLRDDHSVLDLMNARYTYVNERLANHYGIPNVSGNDFRRVELADPTRWGLLGKGAVQMATSYPNRTSPVLRGAWLLENIFGTPPTPPPPSVGGLADNVAGQKALTVRALMEVHRTNPTCNACHGIMDPLGLSLENFDAIGGWRTKDRMAGEVIDASAVMVTGDKMNGVEDLRNQIMKRPEQFVRTFTEKLMIFGLGRSMGYRDMPAIRAIVRDAAADNYRFSTLVMGIVHSDQFRKSRVPGDHDDQDLSAATAH